MIRSRTRREYFVGEKRVIKWIAEPLPDYEPPTITDAQYKIYEPTDEVDSGTMTIDGNEVSLLFTPQVPGEYTIFIDIQVPPELFSKELIVTVHERPDDDDFLRFRLQSKTVQPSKERQVVTADEDDGYYALSDVIVEPMDERYEIVEGTIEITDNGEYDITNYKIANVNIPLSEGVFLPKRIDKEYLPEDPDKGYSKVIIKKIPFSKVSNTSNGYTCIIANTDE